jgi:hypothetical protein
MRRQDLQKGLCHPDVLGFDALSIGGSMVVDLHTKVAT